MNKQLYISEVKSLLIEFYNQLEFQKKLIINSTKSLKRSEQLFYVKKIQNEQINKLFQNNHLIVESYLEIFPKKILSESKFDIKSEMTKFNDFLFLGVCHKIGMIKEDTKINPLKWVKRKIKEQWISGSPQTQTTPINPNLFAPAPQKKSPPFAGNDFYTMDDRTFKYVWGRTKSQYSQETGVPMQYSAEERKKINAANAEYQQRLADSKAKNQPQKNTTTYKGVEVPIIKNTQKSDYLGKNASMELNLRSGQTDDEAARLARVAGKIKEQGGIAAVMEGLRSALFSLLGTAAQILLAITGFGVANDVCWAILAIYDGWQYFKNKGGTTYLVNLIIDILCLATMGTLAGPLSRFAVKGFATGEQFISSLVKSVEMGPKIKSAFPTIKLAFEYVSTTLKTASEYMKKNMGLSWIAEIPAEVASMFNDVKTWIAKAVGETAGAAAGLGSFIVKRAGVELSKKFEVAALQGFEKISPEQVYKWVGRTVEESQLAAAKKTAEESLKDKPTEEVLKVIDSQYGTHMGDLFAIYISTKKLASKNTKYTSGIDAGVKTATTDVMRGKDPSSYKQSATNKLQSGLSGIGIK